MEVFSNLAVSIDGKIATRGREFVSLGSAKDLHLLRKLRNDADAIVYGAGVLRVFPKACLPLDPKRRIVNAVVSRKLAGIDPEWEFFRDPRIDRILYVTEKIPEARRKRFARSCEIVQLSSQNLAPKILRDLGRRGCRRVGVEGGGEIMWEFSKKNLIQRYFVTITPRIVGGQGAPTLVDGAGFDPAELLNLRLEKVRRVGSELFLTYIPVSPRGKRHPLFV